MAADQVKRKLAAILAADIAGYSRLMGADEEGTLARLKALRHELIDPAIAQGGGRMVKTTGDGMLVEFPSVVAAVRSAIDLQRGMAGRNRGLRAEQRIDFRVGIHLGDVVAEGDDLLGDGVNVAARLEGISEAGGIIVSEDAFRQIQDKVAATFADLGPQQLKNIARPVRAFRIEAGDGAPTPASAPAPAASDKASIAVLPFQNMSADPEQEHFADGLAEDIITSLSKVRRLFVIARNSSFTYKGRAVDVRQVARELGVRYVLEGSVRRGGERLRITAQLIDAATGNHIWAERYDRPVRDVFDVQDEITREIVLALSVELTAGERALVFSRQTRSLEAWLAAMRGFDLWVEGSPRAIREAREHFERAVSLDPDYTIAWAFIGWSHWVELRFGFSPDPKASLAKSAELAEKAVAMSPDDPHAHGLRSAVWATQGRFAEAVRESEIATENSPSDAFLRFIFARVLIFAGEAARGVQAVRDAMQLNPFHPIYYLGVLGNGLDELGQSDQAIEILNESVRRVPDYFAAHVRLASIYGLTGRTDEAKAALAAALKINPRFVMSMADAFYASAKPELNERFKRGLGIAGLPD